MPGVHNGVNQTARTSVALLVTPDVEGQVLFLAYSKIGQLIIAKTLFISLIFDRRLKPSTTKR